MDESTLAMAESLTTSAVAFGVAQAINALPIPPKNFNGRCTDCGTTLSEFRINFGAVTCLPCQNLRENACPHSKHSKKRRL